MGIPPTGGSNGGGSNAGCGDLCLSPLEHICTVYCVQAPCVPVSGGRLDTGAKGFQVVVGTVYSEFGRDTDGGLGGGTDGGGERDR